MTEENTTAQTAEKQNSVNSSSYDTILERFNKIASMYGGLGEDGVFSAFSRVMANEPSVQNRRVKAIGTLPADYDKYKLGDFLRSAHTSENELQTVSETFKWTNYSYFKIVKSYADMMTYRHYSLPAYVDKDVLKDKDFLREYRLIDKIEKAVDTEGLGHKVTAQALSSGKVYYILRYDIDRAHNKVNYVFAQRLPQKWCTIIGYNNITGYTVSFNMMYFLEAGTDWRQYGDLFEPYIEDFDSVVEEVSDKFVYASNSGKRYRIALERCNSANEGNPRAFYQNGRYFYYVTLPIDRVWTFEIDDSTAINAPAFAGLFQTLAQQPDYEAAQLSLTLNPLLKIFTGEIPYIPNDATKAQDDYRLSLGGRLLFLTYWNELVRGSNIDGTAFYSAPLENIKSHDYTETSSTNEISSSYNAYAMEKAGLTALIPATDTPHQGMEVYSGYLESRFASRIYRTMEKMMNFIYSSLNLKYEWKFTMFGSVYLDETTRSNAQKSLDKGDVFAWIILAALDGQSLLDKLTASQMIKALDYTSYLEAPQTSYTQSKSGSSTSVSGGNSGTSAEGAPTKGETEKVIDATTSKTETSTTAGAGE